MTVYCPRCGGTRVARLPEPYFRGDGARRGLRYRWCCGACVDAGVNADDATWYESSEVQRLRYLLPRLLRAMDADDPRDVHWMAYSALSVTQQELEARRAR